LILTHGVINMLCNNIIIMIIIIIVIIFESELCGETCVKKLTSVELKMKIY